MGREIAAYPDIRYPSGQARSLRAIMRRPAAQLALAAMVFGQVVMALVNTENFDTPRSSAGMAGVS
jgi:hypothetical protein